MSWFKRLLGASNADLLAATNASEMQKVIAKECCQYEDGGGDVNGKSLRRLFGSFDPAAMAPALSASSMKDLSQLVRITRLLEEKAGAVQGVDDLRSAAGRAIQAALPRTSDAGEARDAILAVCSKYEDASGEVYRKPCMDLFESLEPKSLEPVLKASGLRDLNGLSLSLDRLSEKLGLPRCEGLEQLRAMTNQAVKRALQQSSHELIRARNVEELQKVLAASCCQYEDGSGNVNGEALAALFAGFDQASASAISPALLGSDLKSITGLLATIRRINDRAPRTEKGWLGFQSLVVKACRALLRRAQSAEELRAAIATACLQYDDGSGTVFIKTSKTLFDGMDPATLDKALRNGDSRDLNRLSHSLRVIAGALGADAGGANALLSRVDQAVDAALRAVKASIASARDTDALRTALTSCCRHDDGSGNVYEVALRFLFDGLDPAPAEKILAATNLYSLRQFARALGRMADRLESPCAGLHEWRLAAARAIQKGLSQVMAPEELSDAITAACCQHSDASGQVFPDLTRALFDGFHITVIPTKLIIHSRSDARNSLINVLDRIAAAIGAPPCWGIDHIRLVVQAISVGPEAFVHAWNMSDPGARAASAPQSFAVLPYRDRLTNVAMNQTGGVFESFRASGDWSARLAGLWSEKEPSPQLWLRCASESMAIAILALRSEASDVYVQILPRLIVEGDGAAGVVFRLHDGRQILPLLKELLAGNYGSEKPVISNGAACGMPPGDDKQLVRLLGLKEALTLGSVVSW